MITASELRRITRDTIKEEMDSIKYTILRPLDDEIDLALVECAKANQPYMRRKFTLHKSLPSILYDHFVHEYLPAMFRGAGFSIKNIELERADGGLCLLTLEVNWA